MDCYVRRFLVPALVIAMACIGLWFWQYIAFPGTADYQKLIRTADRVEVRAFMINNEAGGTDFLVLTNPGDLATLADSFRIKGFWKPYDYLIANSMRIRVVREDTKTDIIIRGFWRIRSRSGNWHASLDERFMTTIRQLTKFHDRELPDWKAMVSRREKS